MGVVPADWRFRFMGSSESVNLLPLLPIITSFFIPEMGILMEESGLGILCANSDRSIDSYLSYDWVGAPWSPSSRYGGNGGLSLRRVSSIIQILRDQVRTPNSDPEDVWLTSRLGHRPGAKVANGSTSLEFSGENIFTERPLGYHTGGSGRNLGGGIWGSRELREGVYAYCPEVKMTLEMDAKEFVPGECNSNW
ncbi:MAG: hypothetical protein Q9220_006403 [cf. Caloplaca sp. 1 TL-2023]